MTTKLRMDTEVPRKVALSLRNLAAAVQSGDFARRDRDLALTIRAQAADLEEATKRREGGRYRKPQAQVDRIRAAYVAGESMPRIAAREGVSDMTVSRYCAGLTRGVSEVSEK